MLDAYLYSGLRSPIARHAGKLALHNGSALEAGLELAAELLTGHSGPGRIVALTDAELRTRFRNSLAEQALAAAPSTAVTHVVIPQGDRYAALRRDEPARTLGRHQEAAAQVHVQHRHQERRAHRPVRGREHHRAPTAERHRPAAAA